MTGNVIRPATPTDVDAIARIHVETWRSTYAGTLPDAYLVRMDTNRQRAQWRHMLQRSGRNHRVVVAALPGAGVVGFASCGPSRRDTLPYRAAYDGEIYTLYVAVDYQGQGLGRLLLERCFHILRGQGRTSAVVWVVAANPARFFYEAMGGRRIAERIESFAGSELPELAYGWDLAAATVR